jgi:predicted MPP superfamily phosphohydrolase
MQPPFVTENRRFDFPGLPPGADGLRIVHLSDLHVRILKPRHDLLAGAVNDLSPDLVAVTGDLVSDHPRSVPAACDLLSRLNARLGVWAVQGNWEHKHRRRGPELKAALAEAGVRLLINEAAPLTEGTDPLWLAGIDDPTRGRPDFAEAFRAVPPGAFTLLLAHAPLAAGMLDAWRSARPAGAPDPPRIALILTGHTHGGQIRIPLLWRYFLPRGCAGYSMGEYRVGDTLLYVNRGFSAVGLVPLRFLCPPELALITLRRTP